MTHVLKDFTRDEKVLGYIVLYGASSNKLLNYNTVINQFSVGKWHESTAPIIENIKRPSERIALSRTIKEFLQINNKTVKNSIYESILDTIILAHEKKKDISQVKIKETFLSIISEKIPNESFKTLKILANSLLGINANIFFDNVLKEMFAYANVAKRTKSSDDLNKIFTSINKHDEKNLYESFVELLIAVNYETMSNGFSKAKNNLLSSIKRILSEPTYRKLENLLKPTNDRPAQKAINKIIKEIIGSANPKTARNRIVKQVQSIIIYNEINNGTNTKIILEPETEIFINKGKKIRINGLNKSELEKLYKKYIGNLIGDDIRNTSKNIVENLARISLRGGSHVKDAGGVYFVLSSKVNDLESLKEVLDKLKIGYLKAFALFDNEFERSEVFKSAIIFYEKQVWQIDELLQNFEKGEIIINNDRLDKLLKDLSRIGTNIDLYAKETKHSKSNLLERLKRRIEDLKQRLNELKQ